jgi:hypothetical protein
MNKYGIIRILNQVNMPKEKENRDEYPKVSGNDKRWKQQDEFDSAGAQREAEDEDKNTSIPVSDSVDNKEEKEDTA